MLRQQRADSGLFRRHDGLRARRMGSLRRGSPARLPGEVGIIRHFLDLDVRGWFLQRSAGASANTPIATDVRLPYIDRRRSMSSDSSLDHADPRMQQLKPGRPGAVVTLRHQKRWGTAPCGHLFRRVTVAPVSPHSRTPSVPAITTVADCLSVLEQAYPPAWAESWDAVGLSVGERNTSVERVLFAVDPTLQVAEEARDYGAQLLITHHPLFLRGVHGVP